MTVAREVKRVCVKLGLPFHVKASYRKANRSRLDSFAGIGDEKALAILAEVKAQLDVGIVTDIHLPEEAAVAAHVADVLQIPAFLCRQTDLLVAAAATGKVVNIKKGQFMAPSSMVHAVRKVQESGNEQVWLTERGTMLGYGDLVVDMRGLTEMRAFAPTFMDVTHSLQQPNQASGVTGGRPELIATVARAAVAAGVDGVFIETHPDPSNALSDGANMLPLIGSKAFDHFEQSPHVVSDERLSRTSNLSWQNVARRETRYLAFDQPKPMKQAFALMLLAVSWAAAGQTPDSTNGCTDASACNYNPNATVDDGSCVSCAVVSAFCGIGTIWDATSQRCIGDGFGDINLDGCVQLLDLLDLLGVYGFCRDVCGECTLPNAVSTCLNEVCVIAACNDGFADYNGLDEDGCESEVSSAWSCGEDVLFDNHLYATVQINDQCWFAENLRSTSYANGDVIPGGLNDAGWSTASNGARAVFGEGASVCYGPAPTGDVCNETFSLAAKRLYTCGPRSSRPLSFWMAGANGCRGPCSATVSAAIWLQQMH